MKCGKLIIVEGTDCSGKETQSRLLVEKLKQNGKKVIRFSYPNYDSPTGKIVGGAYLGKPQISPSYFENPVDLDPKVAGLYYAADRKYDAENVKKYLEDGYIVILDRYVNSNMAHQGSKLDKKEDRFAFFKWIDDLEYGLLELPRPDHIIFLYVPLEVSRELKRGREEKPDRHEENEQYLLNAENTYLELTELYHYIQIDCTKNGIMRSIDDIGHDVYQTVCELIS